MALSLEQEPEDLNELRLGVIVDIIKDDEDFCLGLDIITGDGRRVIAWILEDADGVGPGHIQLQHMHE
tara:strand:+ start:101 stop:304 length:204 start_codon:yes stop_codon:yes gene_type:complete